MSAEHDLQQLREALEAAVALDNAWWNDEHADAFAALSRVGERIDAQQQELEDWKRQWESACEDIAIVQSEARSDIERLTRAVHFLSWLVSMDDPSNAVGLEQRRTISLTRIIDNARECLSDLAGVSR